MSASRDPRAHHKPLQERPAQAHHSHHGHHDHHGGHHGPPGGHEQHERHPGAHHQHNPNHKLPRKEVPAEHSGSQQPPPPAKWHTFKMLVDPTIHRGQPKMVRFDGATVPGNPHHLPPSCTDPRKIPQTISALWKRLEPMELPVPRFIIDENYVGDPPRVQVTLDNLNDNIDKQFLQNMVTKYGDLDEIHIEYHPMTKKHLGIARLLFTAVKSARDCVDALHGKSVMGKKLNCFHDPRYVMAKRMIEDLTTERKLPPPIPEPEPEMSQEEEEPPPAAAAKEDSFRSGWESESWESRERSSDREGRGPPERWRNNDRGRWGGDENASDAWEVNNHSEFGERRNSQEDTHSLERDQHRPRGRRQHDRQSSDQERTARERLSELDPRDQNHRSESKERADGQYGEAFDPRLSWNPEYWQQAAVNYAANTLSTIKDTKNTETTGRTEEHSASESEQIDLDTRLQLLMKDKSGSMPAFLLGADSEEEAEKAAHPATEGETDGRQDDLPLSSPPSPFLSEESYLASHQMTRQSDNLEQVNQAMANHTIDGSSKVRPVSRTSDKMSLSSLSPGHNPILEQDTPMWPGIPGHFPGQPYGGWSGFPNGGYGEQSDYWSQYGSVPPHQELITNLGLGYNLPEGYNWQEQWTDPYASVESAKRRINDKDVFGAIIESVMKIVEDELKRILKKDINKKICEILAFHLYDNWWSEQEAKFKDQQAKEAEKKVPGSSAAPLLVADREKVERLPRIPKPEDLTTLIEKRRENLSSASTFGVGGSLGLGFRGTIPKLPKIQRRPKPVEEDSDSEDESRRKKESRKNRKDEKRKESVEDKKADKSQKTKDKDGRTTVSSIYNTIYSDSDESDDKPKDESESSSVESSDDESAKDSAAKSSSASSSESESNKSSSVVSSSSESDSSSEDEDKADKKAEGKKVSKREGRSSSPELKKRSPSRSKSPIRKSPSPPPPRRDDSSSGSMSPILTVVEKKPAEPQEPAEKQKELAPPLKESEKTDKTDKTGSSTDTGNDDEDTPDKENQPKPDHVSKAKEANEDKTKTDSTPVKLKYISESPPPIMDQWDHCYARPASQEVTSKPVNSKQDERSASLDHDYTRPRTPPKQEPIVQPTSAVKRNRKLAASQRPAQPAQRPAFLAQPVKFKQRDLTENFKILYKFLTDGIDQEDIMYLKRSYDMMLLDNQPNLAWINDTHWVDHPITSIPDPPKKKRRTEDFSRHHKTGSARTEGFYKLDPREKSRTKYHFHRAGADPFSTAKLGQKNEEHKPQKAISLSREVRSQQRRLLTALGDEAIDSDLLKFNQLKFRRKQMKFGKSAIHDWGLFAMEPIGADEMVIEYVGDVVRPLLSDIREKRYEKQGIGSSYLFRIDYDYVVDATKCGNLARFINHSCEPNCYAKVIKIDGQSKIVIYSKQPIAIGEEITYDYKFPIEDEKIRCLCGGKNCRKYLN